MKNTFGNNISFTIYGESHGEEIGVVIDGLPSGIKLDLDFINQQINLRKPHGTISTSRKETDEINIVSGFFNGYTTGTPLTIKFKNQNTISKDYHMELLRPSHGDLVAFLKYHGYQDYRGGGHFSGRITVAIVAAGAICLQLLKMKDIKIASHILKLQEFTDTSFSSNTILLDKQIDKCNQSEFSVIDDNVKELMKSRIEDMRLKKDSCGGVIETCVLNVPHSLGEPYFDSVESVLAKLLFSIGGVKGVEFGLGFDFNNYSGSKCNDELHMVDDHIETISNFNGGINGGITNGMPIRIKTVVKPTPSIAQKQNTVNYLTKENTILEINGRHDPCIVHRARVVIDSMVAIGLVDLIMSEYGKHFFEVKND